MQPISALMIAQCFANTVRNATNCLTRLSLIFFFFFYRSPVLYRAEHAIQAVRVCRDGILKALKSAALEVSQYKSSSNTIVYYPKLLHRLIESTEKYHCYHYIYGV